MAIKFNGVSIDPVAQLIDLERADCEESLYEFLRHAWKYLDSSTWVDGWPIEAVAEHLQAVVDGEIRRLIINIPPRMGKSSITSVALPAWTWAQSDRGPTSGPGVQFLHASYANQLSLRDSVKCRRLIESPWYQKLWGDRFVLNSDQNTKSRFSNDQGGERLITSIGAAVTGEGGSCFPDGTMISVPAGKKRIEDLVKGDVVLAFDHLREKVVKSRVVAVSQRLSNELYRVCTVSGHSFSCTGDHRIFVAGRGYIRADQLGRGDRILVERWKEDFSTSSVRSVREESGQGALRGTQGVKTGQQGCLLQHEVLFGASRYKELASSMRRLWKAISSSARSILFGCLQTEGSRGKKDSENVPGMFRLVPWLERLLQQRMCGRSAFKKYARVEKFKVQGAWSLFQPVHSYAGCSDGAGWVPLRVVRDGRRGDEAPIWRETLIASRTSHQRGYAGQQAAEPDHTVHEVPQVASPWEIGAVFSVERHGVSSIRVHDIQVEDHSNFFAEGILVHNCIIVDDPNAANEAFSEATIQATIDWWDGTMSTRLNDPKTGAYIVIQQRLAEDDLTGHILEKNVGEWTHLCLPMRYEPERAFVTSIGWKDPREEAGDLLWTERFGEQEVGLLEKQLGPFATAGQLQQRPEPAGGGVIKRDWWQTWVDPQFPPMDFIVASLDTAYTLKTSNDFSAITIWGVFTEETKAQATRMVGPNGRAMYMDRSYGEGSPKVMLMHAWQQRLELHELVEKVATTCRSLKVDKLLIENKAAGISVAQEMRRLYGNEKFAVQLSDPKSQDKLSRLYSVQHLFAEGMVHSPDRAWADMVITQVGQFPRGKHDDLVDTVSMALRHMRDVGLLQRAPERIADLEAQVTYPRDSGRGEPLYPG